MLALGAALAGIAIAVTLLGLAALAMFPDPALFATILGCV